MFSEKHENEHYYILVAPVFINNGSHSFHACWELSTVLKSTTHHPMPSKVSADWMSCWKCPSTWREQLLCKCQFSVFPVQPSLPSPPLLPFLWQAGIFGVRREKPYNLEWSQIGTAGITADHGLSHLLQQEWKHPSEKGPTSVTGDAWQATTAAHWDPVTTNSGAHGSWGSQDRKIPLWEHITHPS